MLGILLVILFTMLKYTMLIIIVASHMCTKRMMPQSYLSHSTQGGNTALILASLLGHVKVVKSLLQHHANAKICNKVPPVQLCVETHANTISLFCCSMEEQLWRQLSMQITPTSSLYSSSIVKYIDLYQTISFYTDTFWMCLAHKYVHGMWLLVIQYSSGIGIVVII